ncbi:uncharacterized protein LOC106178073 [Lingula anatina]|uniref:Uncharacterized protein LOC106178073 n=1 Tax=Lingula anatina TaxID=7574 RepID=A0A1S3K1N7_LINAN|nr:uncharacterized protein LOC106178073 [Lingula anatina]XP_013416547.1 uncharacterized protein LOC106178073 [Lingula anatina]XP_013416548.1 uncharacterized protein LOC106178073 [Lingula anatina]|eukprot:XP_013416546.1 uncharacterized protein LOC106178073 [Lingula anatina]
MATAIERLKVHGNPVPRKGDLRPRQGNERPFTQGAFDPNIFFDMEDVALEPVGTGPTDVLLNPLNNRTGFYGKKISVTRKNPKDNMGVQDFVITGTTVSHPGHDYLTRSKTTSSMHLPRPAAQEDGNLSGNQKGKYTTGNQPFKVLNLPSLTSIPTPQGLSEPHVSRINHGRELEIAGVYLGPSTSDFETSTEYSSYRRFPKRMKRSIKAEKPTDIDKLQACLNIRQPRDSSSSMQGHNVKLRHNTQFMQRRNYLNPYKNINKNKRPTAFGNFKYQFEHVDSYVNFNQLYSPGQQDMQVSTVLAKQTKAHSDTSILQLMEEMNRPRSRDRRSGTLYSDIGAHSDLDEYFRIRSSRMERRTTASSKSAKSAKTALDNIVPEANEDVEWATQNPPNSPGPRTT